MLHFSKQSGYLYGLVTGLASLIPLPFVDEIVISIIHHFMGKHLLLPHPNPQNKKVKGLWGSSSSLWSRFTGFLWSLPKKLVIKTIQKVFKTVLFWLAIRSAILQAFHTKMVYRASHSALNTGLLNLTQASIDDVIKQIHQELEQSFSNADVKLLTKRTQMKTPAAVEASVSQMVESALGNQNQGANLSA